MGHTEINDGEYTVTTYTNGDRHWVKTDTGRYHRLDGPAVEYANGAKFWFKDGGYHRTDGPAVEYSNGEKFWYIESQKIFCKTQEEFERLMRLKAFW